MQRPSRLPFVSLAARNRLRRAKLSSNQLAGLLNSVSRERRDGNRVNVWIEWNGWLRVVLVEEADASGGVRDMVGARAEGRAVKLEYDSRTNAIYIRLKDGEIATTREVDENLIVDLDAAGRMIGIELLFVSDYLAPEDIDSFTVANLRASA